MKLSRALSDLVKYTCSVGLYDVEAQGVFTHTLRLYNCMIRQLFDKHVLNQLNNTSEDRSAEWIKKEIGTFFLILRKYILYYRDLLTRHSHYYNVFYSSDEL